MTVISEKFTVSSSGNNSITDITQKINSFIQNSSSKYALVNIFVPNEYSSVIVLDVKNNLNQDFIDYMKNLIPINWQKENISNKDIAFAYARASVLGKAITLPTKDGKVELKESQRVVIVDFNVIPSEIEIIASLNT